MMNRGQRGGFDDDDFDVCTMTGIDSVWEDIKSTMQVK